MAKGKTTRRIWRKGPIHAYVQNVLKAEEGKAKQYKSNRAMARSQDTFIRGLEGFEAEILAMTEDYLADVADVLEDQTEWLGDELYAQTPWDPEGPNDPPLHAAEAWKVSVREGKGERIVVSVSNPKNYMQFLADGWSPQAPAGWIDAIYRDYWMRIQSEIRRLK